MPAYALLILPSSNRVYAESATGLAPPAQVAERVFVPASRG
jgi:hypothetical protein